MTGISVNAGALVSGDFRLEEAAGRIIWKKSAGAGAEIAVTYWGGWCAPAQSGVTGPQLPPALSEAVLRTAQMLVGAATREDLTAARFDESFDGLGSHGRSFVDTRRLIAEEIEPLIAPFAAARL